MDTETDLQVPIHNFEEIYSSMYKKRRVSEQKLLCFESLINTFCWIMLVKQQEVGDWPTRGMTMVKWWSAMSLCILGRCWMKQFVSGMRKIGRISSSITCCTFDSNTCCNNQVNAELKFARISFHGNLCMVSSFNLDKETYKKVI